MIPHSSPPNRRGRRIVVAILILGLGSAWWYWPRRDARFVGQWELFRSGESEPYGHMHFERNGEYVFTPATGRHTPQHGGWRVDGSRLRMSSGKLVTCVAPAVLTVEKWIGRKLTYLQEDYPLEITSVTADEILLKKGPRPDDNLTFRRVSE
jgi:hypothetical protein